MNISRSSIDVSKLSGPSRAAILLLSLGDGVSAQVFKRLSETDVMTLSQEISRLGEVSDEVSRAVVSESHASLVGRSQVQGSLDSARRILESAFDPEVAREYIRDISAAGAINVKGLSMLQKADPAQLAELLLAEHPQTAALVLSYLSADQSARALARFDDQARVDVCLRMAQIENVSAPVRDRVIDLLAKRLDSSDQMQSDSGGGVRKVAEILNRMDREKGQSCLETIEHEDPSIALAIRNNMFVFEDIFILGDTEMRRLIQNIDKMVLVTALKGVREDVRRHFFRNMSTRAVEMLREDMDAMGPIRLKDAQKAQREIVSTIRELERTGMIDLDSEGGEEYVS